MNRKAYDKNAMIALTIVTTSFMIVGIAVFGNINAVSAEVFNDHSHESDNKNGEHSNFNSITNIGGKDGDHEGEHCVQNDNNDKGPVCHEISKDR